MDDDDSDSPDQTRRRYSVSPMPQIRSGESQVIMIKLFVCFTKCFNEY